MTQYTPTPAEIETLRKIVNGELDREADYAAIIAANKILDRLSPPAPEVDEATKIWRGMYAVGVDSGTRARFESGELDVPSQISYLRTVLSELIASKDAKRNYEVEFAQQRADENDVRALVAERELAALRTENERLIGALVQIAVFTRGGVIYPGTPEADREQMINIARTAAPRELWYNRALETYEEAAERNTAEQCDKGFDQGSLRPADTAPVIEATEVDAVLVDSLLSYCDSYKLATWSPLYHEVATFRTEAEARGRLEALEEIKKWLRSPEGKGSDAGIDYADGFADQIERMMTGGK